MAGDWQQAVALAEAEEDSDDAGGVLYRRQLARVEIDLYDVLGRAGPVRFRLITEYREGQRLRTCARTLEREDICGQWGDAEAGVCDAWIRAVSWLNAGRAAAGQARAGHSGRRSCLAQPPASLTPNSQPPSPATQQERRRAAGAATSHCRAQRRGRARARTSRP